MFRTNANEKNSFSHFAIAGPLFIYNIHIHSASYFEI